MDQCYHNGDFWQAKTDTSVGQSPTTHPALWSRIQIPKDWRRVLRRLTFANLLELDGQKDKATRERAEAEQQLAEQMRLSANQEAWRNRPQCK